MHITGQNKYDSLRACGISQTERSSMEDWKEKKKRENEKAVEEYKKYVARIEAGRKRRKEPQDGKK